MIQPSNLDLFALLNYVVERQPSALGILVLNPRVRKVAFRKILVSAQVPVDEPDGGTAIQKFAPVMKKARLAMVTFELPERVGANLKGPEPDQALLVAFSIDRAVYDAYVRQAKLAESGIVLPPGAVI